MSLTTKTLEHVVLAYDLPGRRAVDRGKVAEAAQTTAQAEAPHAALAARPWAVRKASSRPTHLARSRRFPPPMSVEEQPVCFVVGDALNCRPVRHLGN